jgi:hypothetical protein
MRWITLVALLVLIPVEAKAQTNSDSPVIVRESFEYGATGRRDPFTPLSAGDELGPRFEDLGLSGIIFSPERGSIAVLVDRATQRRYRVWEGDMIGGARLLAVSEEAAEFLVTVFGVSRRDTLRLRAQDKEQGE